MAGEVDDGLALFEVPKAVVEPLLRSLRMANTAADAVYYDVGVLWLRLFTRGVTISTSVGASPVAARGNRAALQAMMTHIVSLSALTDPEGVILVLDAHRPPFIERYGDVRDFLNDGLEFPGRQAGGDDEPPRMVRTVSITGVGSSALGSAAFAWNLSEALREPVAAIVPGYGLADVIPQALGGYFGFGLHDFLREVAQWALELTAPRTAGIGRQLVRSVPGAASRTRGDSPPFRTGSPESDILHSILENAPQITRLFGHSKGALCVENAIRGLPDERTDGLDITTFGAVIGEECGANFNQIIGRIDGLGQLNSWGNWPERWIESWHSTNTMLPLTMPVSRLIKEGQRWAHFAPAAPPQMLPPPSASC
jgi:hypothetical protein